MKVKLLIGFIGVVLFVAGFVLGVYSITHMFS